MDLAHDRKRRRIHTASTASRKRRAGDPASRSTPRSMSHSFATFLLKDPGVRQQLNSYLSPKDVFSLSQASKAIRAPLRAERWDINRRLKRWVSDPIEFRRQMGRSGALLCGDVAYDFFAGTRTNLDKRTLTILASEAEGMLDYLISKEDYGAIEPATGRLLRNSPDYGEATIQLKATPFPLLAILRTCPIATGNVNFIDCNKAFSMFPYATFATHKMYALQPLDTRFSDFLRAYEELGWGTEDFVRPVSVDGVVKAPSLPASIRSLRKVGDKHTWTMELDSLVTPSSCPTSVLECCEFKVRTTRNAQFFDIEADVMQHPLLAHHYLAIRRDWKQAVLARLNDMLVMELAKLGPEDRRSRKYINKPIWANSVYSVRSLELTPAGKVFAVLGNRSAVADSEGLEKKDHLMTGWQKQLYEARPYSDAQIGFFYLG